MLAASTPPAGRLVAPGGTVGSSANAHLPLTAPSSSALAAVVDVSAKYPVLPLANAAIACAFVQPIAAGSTTLSLVNQSKYVWYAFLTIGSWILAVLPSTSGLPACADMPQTNFHGSKLSL